jgi:hypothetical protein
VESPFTKYAVKFIAVPNRLRNPTEYDDDDDGSAREHVRSTWLEVGCTRLFGLDECTCLISRFLLSCLCTHTGPGVLSDGASTQYRWDAKLCRISSQCLLLSIDPKWYHTSLMHLHQQGGGGGQKMNTTPIATHARTHARTRFSFLFQWFFAPRSQ